MKRLTSFCLFYIQDKSDFRLNSLPWEKQRFQDSKRHLNPIVFYILGKGWASGIYPVI